MQAAEKSEELTGVFFEYEETQQNTATPKMGAGSRKQTKRRCKTLTASESKRRRTNISQKSWGRGATRIR
jgi:hypothetical protein